MSASDSLCPWRPSSHRAIAGAVQPPPQPTSAARRLRTARISWRTVPSCRNPVVSSFDVALDEFLKLFGYAITFERHRLRAVFVHRRHGVFSRARKANADIRVLALARAVDHASHDGNRHVFDPGTLLAPF